MANRYAVTNYPSFGDETYFDYAFCTNCGNHVHAYAYIYFRQKKKTETVISGKHDRRKFQQLIEDGQAFIIPRHQDEIPRNTRAQVLACEWTLMTMRPADSTASYLHRNEQAPWVSNNAERILNSKRERWVKKLRRG